MTESYNNARQNRTTTIANSSPRWGTKLSLLYAAANKVAISGIDTGDGNYMVSTTTGQQQTLLEADNANWLLDLTTNTINKQTRTGGYIDGVGKIVNRFLLCFALFKSKTTSALPDGRSDKIDVIFDGFGICNQPKTTTLSVTGTPNKGSSVTFGLNQAAGNSARSFTVGAKVLIWFTHNNWNTGYINNIIDDWKLKITLDNISSGAGYNLTGVGFNIIQLDRFRPYVMPNGLDYTNNYKLITGGLRINAASNLIPFAYDRGHYRLDSRGQYSTTNVAGQLYHSMYDFVSPTAREAYVLFMSSLGDNVFGNIYCSSRYGVTINNRWINSIFSAYPLVYTYQPQSGSLSLTHCGFFEPTY